MSDLIMHCESLVKVDNFLKISGTEMQTAESIESMESRGIAVCQLPTISLEKLEKGDERELGELERAASVNGIFHLDLRGSVEGRRMLRNLSTMYGVSRNFFDQSETCKMEYVRNDRRSTQDLGWMKGPGVESFELSRDEMKTYDANDVRVPSVFKQEWKGIEDFSSGCDRACLTVLKVLSAESAASHRLHQPSDTGLKVVSFPALAKRCDALDNLHTDSGTVTLLFYLEWGVHVFLRDASIWAFVPPVDGCALMNVGNALWTLSGGRFHSPEHRVTQPLDGAKDRYYLSYFLRPEISLIERWATEEERLRQS